MKQILLFCTLFISLTFTGARAGNTHPPLKQTDPGLAITISPALGSYTVGQSVTVVVTGATTSLTYSINGVDDPGGADGVFGIDAVNSQGVLINAMSGVSSETFVVTFREPTTTANAFLYVIDNDNTESALSANAFQVVCPTYSLTASPSLTVSSGTSVTLAVQAGVAAGITSYTWSTGANTASISFTPTSTTVLSVTALAGSGNSACRQVLSTTVTVEASLSLVTAASPSTVCVGGMATLSVTASGGTSPHNYTWVAPGGASISGSPNLSAITTTLSASGVQTFTVTVSGAGGTPVSTTVVNVTVVAPPSLTINAIPSLTASNGSGLTLVASGATTYTWSTGQTGSTISFTPTSGSTISLTGSTGSCSATTTTTISVTGVVLDVQNLGTVTLGPGNCPGAISFLGSGRRFEVTGPNSYYKNLPQLTLAVNRSITVNSLRTTGQYTIKVYGNAGQTPIFFTFQVIGTSCP